jgi:hypothetical protein
MTRRSRQEDLLRARPLASAREQRAGGQVPPLDTPMPLVHRLRAAQRRGQVRGRRQEPRNVLPHVRLIVLGHQHVVSSVIDDGLRDRALREQGVPRDHPPGEEHVPQDGVHRADLIGLLVHGRLGQRQTQPLTQGRE